LIKVFICRVDIHWSRSADEILTWRQFMSAALHSDLSPDLRNFLYSPISDDPGELPVSVLSAIARHDVDPWDEAARLARMPKAVAIARLTSMISPANSDAKVRSQAELIAARLVDLLPRPTILAIPQLDGVRLPLPIDFLRTIACIAVAALLIALAVFAD
jgi:hypothetical protein